MSIDPESSAILGAVIGPLRGAMPVSPGGPRLDAFGRQAGPDVAIATGPVIVRVYAVFEIDPGSQRLRVRVVDDRGHLVRMIPPASVNEMIVTMAKYRG